ncbi:carboxymuconolactone decarboxylase family protein [Clostridium felsineum]|uniref:carboxymuconolactone decarboxylase family protein n=1 Tax=Clostridium felsineum TaxID=36839 RepID=UPI00214DA5A6|nr:carboxymuconolactone decarboxylase family protein [Clostridium felsineum]MCR3760264.1 carboxymuconolactone decarboxylase family protein [Clostridium felsineum]
MNRIEISNETMKHLYGSDENKIKQTDKDFFDIKTRLVYGEVYNHIKLSSKMRELILLVVATTNLTMKEVSKHTKAALSEKVAPEAIKEAVYSAGAYIGLGKVEMAVEVVNKVFEEEGISIVESQKTVTEDSRLQKGIKAQKDIFGEKIDNMRASAPKNQKHIQDFLSAYCFGDFYTRKSLDLKERELLTFSIITAQGGCEPQLVAHVAGNVAMGNGKDVLLDALTLCMPYIGFPKALNALAVVNKVIED